MASNLYPKMDRSNRAKQFMPFDALKGLREALIEMERLVVSKRELSKERMEELDYLLCQIQEKDIIMAEYFQNGEYRRVKGEVCKIDKTKRILEIENVRIPFEDIYDLQKENL